MSNKNAVVTGGTKGIGRAIADALSSDGYEIIVVARSMPDLKRMQLEYQENGNQLIICQADLSTEEGVAKCYATIEEYFEKLDVLINNAGVFLPGNLLEESESQLVKQMNTNLYSAYRMTRSCIELIRKSDRGHIFNMCSVASKKAYPGGGSYCISKHALLGFNNCLREDLKQEGISVTAVLPGATWSNSWSGVDLPQERLMQASDVAKCILTALNLNENAVMEEIVIRPQLGDL